jgi:hypothetical protein
VTHFSVLLVLGHSGRLFLSPNWMYAPQKSIRNQTQEACFVLYNPDLPMVFGILIVLMVITAIAFITVIIAPIITAVPIMWTPSPSHCKEQYSNQ